MSIYIGLSNIHVCLTESEHSRIQCMKRTHRKTASVNYNIDTLLSVEICVLSVVARLFIMLVHFIL